jgi:hypothetical protein
VLLNQTTTLGMNLVAMIFVKSEKSFNTVFERVCVCVCVCVCVYVCVRERERGGREDKRKGCFPPRVCSLRNYSSTYIGLTMITIINIMVTDLISWF